jgi:hypothetical protein
MLVLKERSGWQAIIIYGVHIGREYGCKYSKILKCDLLFYLAGKGEIVVRRYYLLLAGLRGRERGQRTTIHLNIEG